METRPETRRAALDQRYPRFDSQLPATEIEGASYVTRFARDRDDLTAIQKLRFEVFNLELHEGLESSYLTGLDQDQFDLACHHVLVAERRTGEIVGTYRVQTLAMAEKSFGLYTASEFDLSRFPSAMLEASVETGRACVAREHRNGRVLNQLWKGLATYLAWNAKRCLFGCCSLTSQDPHVARQTYEFLASGSYLHTSLAARPRAGFECYEPGFRPDVNVSVKLPPLFASYLKLGAKIVGEPALDREFKTIDFLTVLDVRDLELHTYRAFFK